MSDGQIVVRKTCHVCNGSGVVEEKPLLHWLFSSSYLVPCPLCKGFGSVEVISIDNENQDKTQEK